MSHMSRVLSATLPFYSIVSGFVAVQDLQELYLTMEMSSPAVSFKSYLAVMKSSLSLPWLEIRKATAS
jgi:hypothetical protein